MKVPFKDFSFRQAVNGCALIEGDVYSEAVNRKDTVIAPIPQLAGFKPDKLNLIDKMSSENLEVYSVTLATDPLKG